MIPEPCVATIGFFDGVHMGHRYLIQQVKEIAAAKGLRSALVTFPVHPRKVMNAAYHPELLTTPEEKTNLLAGTGVDYCLMLDFDGKYLLADGIDAETGEKRDGFYIYSEQYADIFQFVGHTSEMN